jgi:ribonuclease III
MDLSLLSKKLDLKFKDIELYVEAFTHRSYLNEHPDAQKHNERLEFLGDAVVELLVTQFLYNRFPDKPEGELTNLRAALVKRDTLSEIGAELEFDNYIRMSRGEAKNTGKARGVILSNTAEAFIGALFLDLGLKAVDKVLDKFLLPKLEAILAEESHVDAKSRFQELVQERDGITPHYETVEVSGPDHDRHFTVGVYIGERLVAKGEGSSKREAETNAAAAALTNI